VFDLSILIDLARDNPAVIGLVGTGTVGGVGLAFRARLRKARRIDQEAGVPAAAAPKSPTGLLDRLVESIDRFVTNREKAARRNRVLEHAAECKDAQQRQAIAELEKVWTLAEVQEALNSKIAPGEIVRLMCDVPAEQPTVEAGLPRGHPPRQRRRNGRR
jgi:hypothetical protein